MLTINRLSSVVDESIPSGHKTEPVICQLLMRVFECAIMSACLKLGIEQKTLRLLSEHVTHSAATAIETLLDMIWISKDLSFQISERVSEWTTGGAGYQTKEPMFVIRARKPQRRNRF